MAAIEVFSSCVNYKYKSKICSLGFLTVLLFITLSLLTPFFIIHNSGGFSLKNRVYAERPEILFNYKYLLLANRGYNIDPIVCSAFTMYKNNKIIDGCTLIKVQEIDKNSDGKKDILKFEAHFYTNTPIKSFKLLLFFNVQLKQLFKVTIESIVLVDYTLNENIQKVQFYGDLILQQKTVLNADDLYDTHNQSIEMADYSLKDLLMQNSNKKFTAEITNKYITEQVGYSKQNTVIISGEVFYRDLLIHYQPSIWEELKWAWVQYLSYLLIFVYIMKHILMFLFSKRYLNSYIIVPWKEK